MDSNVERPRLLIVPGITHGHFAPGLQLMQLLVKRGVSFTVWTVKERCSELRSYAAKGAFETLDVEIVEFFTWEQSAGFVGMSMQFTQQLESAKARGEVDLSGFSGIISDMFFAFIQNLADENKVPNYYLYTSPAAAVSLFVHGTKLIDGGWYPANKEKKDEFVPFLGLQLFTAGEIPDNITPMSRIMIERLEVAVTGAAGVIVNSFDAYDKTSADELRLSLQSSSHPDKIAHGVKKVYCVGPLHFVKGFSATQDKPEKHESLDWLDQQPNAAVLFACFGSMLTMSEEKILAIAKALLVTEVPFLWALRLPKGYTKEQLLPDGFEERTKHRGLIVTSWVPQKEILKHPSVGGFLSHCGWNSILESVDGGVPIIACPMYAEQSMNARYMSERVGIAVRVKGYTGHFESEDIAAGITTLMKGNGGQQVRKNVEKLRAEAYAAVEEGGSSDQQIAEFCVDISRA